MPDLQPNLKIHHSLEHHLVEKKNLSPHLTSAF